MRNIPLHVLKMSFSLFLIVDCRWNPWINETINGYERKCKNLDCKKGGLEPERARGERHRTIKQRDEHGGKECQGEENEECEADCPGT